MELLLSWSSKSLPNLVALCKRKLPTLVAFFTADDQKKVSSRHKGQLDTLILKGCMVNMVNVGMISV